MENKSAIPPRLRRWGVSPKRAMSIQQELRRYWIGEDRFGKITTVAGLDAAFVLVGSQALPKKQRPNRWNAMHVANRAIGCVVMYRYPEMLELQRAFAILPLQFPYVPGLLSFREIPLLLAALKKLRAMPDVLFCDGQGIAHPRRLGLATHLGILLNRPTIGCAKSRLFGVHTAPGRSAGSWSPLLDATSANQTIGAVLRTRANVNPIYVSQGHRISLTSALQLTLSVTDGFRIPRPTRDADRFAALIKRNLLHPAIRKTNPS
jgi:deoxyribonuclease V